MPRCDWEGGCCRRHPRVCDVEQALPPSMHVFQGLAAQLRTQANATSGSFRFSRNPTARRVSVIRPAFEMFVHDPSACLISQTLLRERSWEERELTVVLTALLSGSAAGFFLDIGSNIGVYALSAAAAGIPTVAFEPLTFNVELLAASAALARRRKVPLLAVHAAVAATPSRTPVCVRPFNTHATKAAANAGNGQLSLGASPSSVGESSACASGELVTVTTVDTVLSSDPTLAAACFTAAKVDVEGYEAAALRGASGVLGGRCPPCLVFLETQPAVAASVGFGKSEAFDVLNGHGFRCRPIVLKKKEQRDFACWRPAVTPRCREPVAAAKACLATTGHRLCKAYVEHAVLVRTG